MSQHQESRSHEHEAGRPDRPERQVRRRQLELDLLRASHQIPPKEPLRGLGLRKVGRREPGGLLRHGLRLPERPRPPGRDRERVRDLSAERLGIQRFVELDGCKFGSQSDIFSTNNCLQRDVNCA